MAVVDGEEKELEHELELLVVLLQELGEGGDEFSLGGGES